MRSFNHNNRSKSLNKKSRASNTDCAGKIKVKNVKPDRSVTRKEKKVMYKFTTHNL